MQFIRSLFYSNPNNPTRDTSVLMKFLYEFFNYCVMGGGSPTTPGGMPSTTPSNYGGGTYPSISLEPTNGNTYHPVKGIDGSTTLGGNTFQSVGATFTSNMVGMFLVVWDPAVSPGSRTSEDSIYPIIGLQNANTIIINQYTGGVPDPSTSVVRLTTRSNLRFRVVDVIGAASLNGSMTNGQYIVFTLKGSQVNSGAADSQIRLALASSGGTVFDQLTISLSPAGTWNGSAFTDETATQTSQHTGNNNTSNGSFTMMADPTCFMWHAKGPASNGIVNGGSASIVHVEIPKRIGDNTQSPNPIAFTTSYMSSAFQYNSETSGYNGGWRLVGKIGNALETYYTLVKSVFGTDTNSNIGSRSNSSGVRFSNPFNGQYLFSPMILTNSYVTGGCLIRCQLRKVVSVGGINLPPGQKFGNNGEWLLMDSGICWPWDGGSIHRSILPYGS